jgi:Spy/CpxP family protein refolding chaperone
MSGKNIVKNQNKSGQSGTEKVRETKIMNAIVNTSIILMSTLMGGFSEVMTKASDAMASGMAEAFGGEKTGEEVHQEMQQKMPEVNDKMKAMMSDLRKDIYSQIEKKRKEIEPFLANPVFDEGLKKIEQYDFGVPKLTEELDDDALAKYNQLLVSEDPAFAQLFTALAEWIKKLPAPKDTNEK